MDPLVVAHGLSSCDERAKLLLTMWILIPWPGIKPRPLYCKADSSLLDHKGSPSHGVLMSNLLPTPPFLSPS